MLKALFEVAVKSTGLGKAKADTDALGKSAQNVGKAHNTARDAAEAHYAVQAKGVIGTANSTKSFSKLARTMGEGGGIVGAYATLAANVFAVTAAFNALKGAAQVEQITRGLEVLGARSGQSLGLVAKQLKEVTNGALSTEQALRSTAQITSAGFKSDTVTRIGKLSSDVSLALGRDMTDSMDRLTRGVIKLEPELLDELGLMTRLGEASAAYALELGKPVTALTTLEKRQGFLNAVMAEGELKFGGVSDAAGDLKNYDKLAATFKDLANTVLKTINALGGLSIAGFFANNMTALAGAAVLFLSTLKSQLLPGLLSITDKAAAIAKDAKESALKEQKDILEFNQNPSYLNPIKKLGDAAGVDDYTKALERNAVAIARLEKVERAQSTASNVNTDARERTQSSLRMHREVTAELTQALYANHKATTTQTASNAVASASSLNFGASVHFLKASILSYAQQAMVASGATTLFQRTMVAGKTAAYAFGLSVKMIGAALLAAIPYIGIATVALGFLVQMYDRFIKSDEAKAKEKALKDILELTKTTVEKEKALLKIEESRATAAARVHAQIVLQSNAVGELVNKYKEVSAEIAKTASTGRTAQPSSVASIWDIVGNNAVELTEMGSNPNAQSRERRLVNSRTAGVNRNSEILSQLDSNRIIDPAAIATLDSLNRIAPEITENVIDMYGGLQNLSDVELSERTPKIIAEIGRRAEGAAELVESLTTGLRELEAAYSAYISAASAKTPFDNLVTASNKSVEAINSLRVATANGVAVASDWQLLLTSIGEKTRNTLSPETFGKLAQLEENIGRVRQLELMPVAARTANYDIDLKNAKDMVLNRTVILGLVRAEIIAQGERLKQLKAQDALLQSQLVMAKARLDTNSRDNALTAEGVEAQLRAENSIKDLEVQRLQINMSLLDSEISRNEILVRQLETKKLIQDLDNESYRGILLANLASNRSLLIARETYNARNPNSKLETESVQRQIDLGMEQLTNLTAIESAQESISGALAAQVALQGQVAAIVESQKTEAEIAAAKQKARLQIAIREYNLAEDIYAMDVQSATINAKIANIRNGSAGTMAEQLLILRESTAEELRRKRVQDQIALASIRAERAEANARRSAGAADVALDSQFQRQLDNTQRLQEAEARNIVLANEQRELELVTFNLRKEGLEWQKQSLEYLEKIVTEQENLIRLSNEGVRLDAELNRRRRGIAQSESSQAADSLSAQQEAYRILVDGLELKKSMIDLEFALLDAQRLTMAADLRARVASGRLTQDQVNTLEHILVTLNGVNTEGARLAARAAADAQVGNARTSLLIASQRTGNVTLGSEISGILELQAQRRRASATADYSAPILGNNAIIPEAITDIAPVGRTLVESNTVLADALTKLTDVITGVREVATGQTFSSPQAALEAVISAARQNGVNAHESPTTGGVSPRRRDAQGRLVGGHAGNAHYEGRAVDLYSLPGNQESTNPAERAKFDRLATQFRSMGATVLWQVRGHFDHMHVEFARDFTRFSEAAAIISEANIALPPELLSAIPEAVAQSTQETISALSDVVVGSSGVAGVSTKTGGVPVNATPIRDFAELWDGFYNKLFSDLESLGPEGKALALAQAGISSFAQNIENVFEVLNSKTDLNTKIQAVGGIASSAVASLQGVLAAASEAKIAGIEKEIAAEQRRDGKSAESVAKILALEKKKEAAAKKAFDVNKKLQMAQAVISIATGVSMALGTLPPPLSFAMAGLVAAMGAAQLATIAGTSYSGGVASTATVSTPSTLSIGKRGDSVDLAKNNPNAGGEIGYLRGARGRGTSSANYSLIGSAYGGAMPRGYGNTAFVVGEHGPETITPDTPITVRPSNDNADGQRALPPVNINIQALDAKGVEEILYGQRGNIIGMLREAANNSGQTFLESVNTAVYNKPNVGRL